MLPPENKLYKIFHNTIKISHGCFSSVRALIEGYIKRVLNSDEDTENERKCN